MENKIAKMYEFVHRNLDPVLDTFTALVETPEGRAALEEDWLNLKWARD